jgi:hypothetical protein
MPASCIGRASGSTRARTSRPFASTICATPFATLQLAAGTNPKIVSEVLGHKDVGQTAVEDSPQLAYRYDPPSDSWESVGEMPLRASALSATVVGDRVWVLARDWTWLAPTPDPAPDERFGRVLVFDPGAERWSVSDQRVNPLGGGGTQMAVPLANGDLYVVVASPCCTTSNTIHTSDEP